MSDEVAIAVAAAMRARHTVALVAGDDANIVDIVVVVAHVVGQRTLLVRPVVRPLRAVVVAAVFSRAVFPALEELLGPVALLGDDEARVPHDLAVEVAVLLRVRVFGQGEEGVFGDVPPAHEPFEGEVDVFKDGVRVEEDNDVVRLEGLAHHRDLDPGAVSVFEFGGADQSVVVAVDKS